MSNTKRFSSRKEVTEFLKEKGINTSNWSEEKWLSLNKGAAEIHIMDLAEKMWDVYNESKPKQLKVGEWHIPFGEFNTPQKENNYIDWEAKYIHAKIMKEKNRLPLVEELISESKRTRIKIATARCARISYETLGDNPEINYEKDIKLHDDLLAMKHFSPFEHCCIVPSEQEYNEARKGKETGWFYNLKGFKSYRFSMVKVQEIALEENLIHQMGINGNTNNIEKLQNNGK